MREWHLYNEDCLEGMKRLSDESIDLVVTSPPYDNLRLYNGFKFDFKAIARELYRVLRIGGDNSMDCIRRNGERLGNGNKFQTSLVF